METKQDKKKEVGRRDFLRATSTIAAGVSVLTAKKSLGEDVPQPVRFQEDLNVAFIGVGAQGTQLLESAKPIPGLRYKAVCDIWPYNRQAGAGRLRAYNGYEVNQYENYLDMLAKEDLDAVIVATPDWMHAEHANTCMRAGLDVYCEKEMSNSLEKARTMVHTARETGRKLQIGHQRRSNPRYIHAFDTVVKEERLIGRVTQAYAQWNRSASEDLSWAPKFELDQATLDMYGYDSMHHFRNWRWYKKYGGGPIVDLGSHQIDLFAWVFGVNPRSVIASGGLDYYQQHEWYDTVMAIFEYENDEGISRAMYQVLTTSSNGGFYENFMGVLGTLQISEVPFRANGVAKEGNVTPEVTAKWEDAARRGIINMKQEALQRVVTKQTAKDSRETPPPEVWPLPIVLNKQAHTPHLENFFDAIRLGKDLNCPPEIGYETAVAVLRVNEAVEAQRRLEFRPEDFEV